MKPEWIFYPGDLAASLLLKVASGRYYREALIPPFWRIDGFNQDVRFTKRFELTEPEVIEIRANPTAKLGVYVNSGDPIADFNGQLSLGPGAYEIIITLFDEKALPCLYVNSKSLSSDSTWFASRNDNLYVKAGSDGFYDPECPPSAYRLSVSKIEPSSKKNLGGQILYDLGEEKIVFVKRSGAKPLRLYFGESQEEALDEGRCETLYDFKDGEAISSVSKGCRYVSLKSQDDEPLEFYEQKAEHPFQPSFHSDDKTLNRIYEVSLHTLDLCTRELFIDGPKRDRWPWGGDAYQTGLMSYYSFFDGPTAKRTLLALLGKKPYSAHINHIMDYSLLWFIAFRDYLYFSGDLEFGKAHIDEAVDFLAFVLARRNKNGLLERMPGDWVFVDWSISEKENDGEVAAEQMLLYAALSSMSEVFRLLQKEGGAYFDRLKDRLKDQIEEFYSPEKHRYLYSRQNGKYLDNESPIPNIFAILFDVADERRKKTLVDDSLLAVNPTQRSTPYMQFFRLEALLKMGEQKRVYSAISDYWNGMIKMGATSFWEDFDPKEKAPACYAMYGRPYGKSLCHAWGAGPLYFLGRYYLGLAPTSPGYQTFSCRPCLEVLGDFRAQLPLGDGEFTIERTGKRLTISFTKGTCSLFINDKEMTLNNHTDYTIEIK